MSPPGIEPATLGLPARYLDRLTSEQLFTLLRISKMFYA